MGIMAGERFITPDGRRVSNLTLSCFAAITRSHVDGRYGPGYSTPFAGNSIGMALTHGWMAGKFAVTL